MFARLSKRFGAKHEKSGWNEKKTIDGVVYYFNNQSGELTWEKPFDLMTAQEKEDGHASWVWIPHPDFLWQPAKLLKQHEGEAETKTEDGKKVSVKKGMNCSSLTGGRDQQVPLWNLKLSSLRMPEDDLVMLDDPNEALIMHNLRIRYKKDELYTWVGQGRNVLISINPFKKLPLYGKDMIDLHKNRPPNVALKPHVFDIGHDSYQSLLFEKKHQSILISGESGAGKTVATKQILNYLADVAGSSANVEEKILSANPLLEAFGNAQTIRNNNSSRFGKYIEIHFDPVDSIITSASIQEYLLEKSRVVLQQGNERNYHIFYQITGATGTKSELGLESPENYEYLNKSGCYKAKDIDDVEEHKAVLDSFDMLGFSKEEKEFALRVTAGVLNLGNVLFKAKAEANRVEGSQVADSKPLKIAADFLGVTEKDLQNVVCYRTISVRGKSSTIPLDPEKARKGTDSLAMDIYGRLFTWLVDKVNVSLEGPRSRHIGLLDIFGFEIFDNNSFEQLLINFANEKLQQQFNKTTFKNEEALYAREGINYNHVEFIDNQIVLDLIEARPHGLLLLLDDETKIPKGSDASYLNKVESQYRRHEKFQTDQKRRLLDSLNFEIVHYAGVVNYNGEGFKVKNTDTLFQDMYDLMANSSAQFMGALFPPMDTRRQQKSLSYQFRQQLNSLMDSINQTESRYIRCIKPNSKQAANQFEAPMVLDQLKYSGIFEAVEIRRQGYPFRLTYAQFACRYGCINPKHKYKNTDPEKRVKEILAVSKQDFTDVAYGKTMILYRSREHKLLQLMRNLALETLIPKQQAVIKGGITREFRRRLVACEKKVQHALNVGNDIDLVDEAIKAVEPTLKELGDMFPYRPRNLQEAKELRKDLQKWKDLEAKLEKLVKEDPNKVYYKLADAVEEGNKLMHIKRTDRQIELMDEALRLRASCELGKIDAEAKEALKELDEDRMVAVLERAGKHNHTNDDLKEIKRLLNLPELEWCEIQLEKAKEKGDKSKVIELEIRIEDLYLDENRSKYESITKFGKLKHPDDYKKAKFLGGQKVADNMLYWTKAATHTSLTALEAGKPAEKEAVAISKLIRIYAGEKKGKQTSEEAAAEILQRIFSAGEPMVDETYVQVLKQLRRNPESENAAKYFDLLALLMSTIAPSKELERFTVVYLQDSAPAEIGVRRFTSALHEVQYGKSGKPIPASKIQSTLEQFKTNKKGSRFSKKRIVEEDEEQEEEPADE